VNAAGEGGEAGRPLLSEASERRSGHKPPERNRPVAPLNQIGNLLSLRQGRRQALPGQTEDVLRGRVWRAFQTGAQVCHRAARQAGSEAVIMAQAVVRRLCVDAGRATRAAAVLTRAPDCGQPYFDP
jgi:hypothetical protein